MKKLFLATIIGGIMVATVGAYAATLGGTNAAEGLGSTGNIQVNAPGVGDVDLTWDIDKDNSSAGFGRLTGVSMAVQNAPATGQAYDVLVRVEDGAGNLLGGATGTIAAGATSVDLDFGAELDPEDVENAIVVIDEG